MCKHVQFLDFGLMKMMQFALEEREYHENSRNIQRSNGTAIRRADSPALHKSEKFLLESMFCVF